MPADRYIWAMEKIITRHLHLAKYPIDKAARKLIVGTIHPHNHETFLIPFFYGNKNSIWEIFADAFPEDLPKPITLEKVLHFLKKKKIAISDTIVECERQSSMYLDNDLIPLKLNTGLLLQIKNAEITDVYFTSGFGKNSAFKLFYTGILQKKITRKIRENRKVVLDKNIFGRVVTLHVLYSPSGSANIAWATSEMYREKAHRYKNSARPVYAFKVDYYRERFR